MSDREEDGREEDVIPIREEETFSYEATKKIFWSFTSWVLESVKALFILFGGS